MVAAATFGGAFILVVRVFPSNMAPWAPAADTATPAGLRPMCIGMGLIMWLRGMAKGVRGVPPDPVAKAVAATGAVAVDMGMAFSSFIANKCLCISTLPRPEGKEMKRKQYNR